MAQYITWDQCYWAVSDMHFAASYTNVWVLVGALAFFVAYKVFMWSYHQDGSALQKLSEERAYTISQALLTAGMFCVAAYVVWFVFFFKPEAVQVQASHLAALLKNASTVSYSPLPGMI